MASDQQRRRGCYQKPSSQAAAQPKKKQNLGQQPVDPEVWKACAGPCVQIPAVNSSVYYFPEGHIELSSLSLSEITLSPLATSRPCIACRVVEVSYLADPDTDEVFAKIRLEPLPSGFGPSRVAVESSGFDVGGGERESDVIPYAKALTPSDANNGGGFSVPRECADSVFPPLDYEAEPPVQNIRISDVHGEVWEFRHIYRGTPRRHLLTTGWSKFVNSKKLIAGDWVVFMRKKVSRELFVGVRRAVKSNVSTAWAASQYAGYGEASASAPAPAPVTGGGFSRDGKGRVPAEAVMEAIERAANNLTFDVVYYPRVGMPDFVVAAEKVDTAMRVYWSPGMKVKFAMDSEGSSLKIEWHQGTVNSVVYSEHGPWQGSYWRMLQVDWDEPDKQQKMKRVNPWQVDYVVPPTPIPTAFSPAKRLRVSPNSALLSDGEGDGPPLPSIGISSVMGQLNSPHLSYNFPAGMQGARQNVYFVPRFSSSMNDGTRQVCREDYFENVLQRVEPVSTDLNICCSSPETPSPDSHSSVQLFGTDTSGQRPSNTSEKTGTFQLFGQIIQKRPPTSDTTYTECYDDSQLVNFHDRSVLNVRDPL